MTKFGKFKIIFLLLAAQTILAISIGLAVLLSIYENSIPPGTYVGSTNIGKFSREEANEKIKQYYDGIIRDGSIIIKLNGKKEFKIGYGEIDASLDSKATVDHAYGKAFPDRVLGVISGCFFYNGINKIDPVINYNEGKLREKLNEIAKTVNIEPVNASVYVKNGRIIKENGIAGIILNVENALNKLKKEMGSSLDSFIEFNVKNDYEVKSIRPQYTIQTFEGADVILSEYTTDISSQLLINSSIIAANAINGAVIGQSGSEGDVFSFNRYLNEKERPAGKEDEGYDIVASTLYKAVLLSGIDHTNIVRTPHKKAVEYMEPGLDVRILDGEADLRFKNTLGCKLFIFAEVKDNKVTVSLAGSAENKGGQSYRIETEVIQKFSPAVINVENQQLKQGEKKVILPGKEGMKVNVYRVAYKDGKEVERIFLYSDKYDAIDKIVEIGPDTKWEDDAGLK